MRLRLAVLLLLVLTAVGAPGQASADTTTVTDPKGDGGDYDIRSLFVDNGSSTITFRLKFVSLLEAPFGGDEVHIFHPKSDREWVLKAWRSPMNGKWSYTLHPVASDGNYGAEIPCQVSHKRDADTEIARYGFARSCISNLPSGLRFSAWAANTTEDVTAKSALLAKG